MIKYSRFTKVAVSAGLIVASGAAVLGLTSFASAELAADRDGRIEVTDTIAPESAVDETPASADDIQRIEDRWVVASAGTGSGTTVDTDPTTESTSKPPRFDRVAVIAQALGMTESELIGELNVGKSIADVAEARNVDIDTVIAALSAAFKAHLDEEVASGKITREVADAKLVLFTARHSEMVNRRGILDRDHGGKGHGRGDHDKGDRDRDHREGRGHGPRFLSENLATTLKLSLDELKTQMLNGKSLAGIAEAQGVEISAVKETLIADFKAHLDEEVASGEHTREEADAKLAVFESRLDDMVNRARPERGPRMDRDGRGDN